MEAKIPFKTLLGHGLVKDETGRDMHKSWGNAIWFEDAAEKMGVDTMRWLYSSQNPENNLLFGYSIADEVRKNLITLWNTYSFFTTYAILDNFKPNENNFNKNNLNELDNWILAKTNNFIKIAESNYENYEIYRLMKTSSELLDDISNWYVRRNRRRFWRSENDNDKMAAYSTLYKVLITYIKVLAPIIPFLTEKIYCNLVWNIDKTQPKSIHLTEFPSFDPELQNDELVNEIDAIKNIVSLGRSARNKVNIKIRQPLSEVLIYTNEKNLMKYNNQILDELNVKNVKFVDSPDEIVKHEIKPNYSILGQRFGSGLSKVVKELNSIPVEKILLDIKNDGEVSVIDHILSLDEIEINELPLYDFLSISSNQSIKVAINTKIDKNLLEEGMVRDFIRAVQNFRKESDFEVDDRINLTISCNDDFYSALQNNIDYFKGETLCQEIKRVKNLNNDAKLKIDTQNIEIAIERL